MGRAGRYTLSVMAWVAAYAGWSSVIGLVVAALTGDRPRSVSPGVSALLTVIGPLVPTLVALWFNDWARDGFPSREQQRAARARRAAAAPAAEVPEPVAEVPEPVAEVPEPVAEVPAPVETPEPAVEPPPPALAAPAAPAYRAAPPTVPAHPLGVPGTPATEAPAGAFPVAPLLHDRD